MIRAFEVLLKYVNHFQPTPLNITIIIYNLQIWDLRAGKMMTELTNHGGPVYDVEFHPHVFLLASGELKTKSISNR